MNNIYVGQVCICPINCLDRGYIIHKGEYDYRWCIIDNNNNYAIDIEHELKYNYIKTMNGIYFVDESQKLIEDGKRVAIFPVNNLEIPKNILIKSKKIINLLDQGVEFKNGNDVYNNDDYLEKIKEFKYVQPKTKVKKQKKV